MTDVTRRSFIAGALASGVSIPVGFAALSPQDVRASVSADQLDFRFRNSLSASPFTEGVLSLTALSDGRFIANTVEEVQELFNRHGATEIYARIATRKLAGQPNGWGIGLERAQLAAKLDMPFNPELMLDNTYGDAQTYQDPPDFADYPQIAALLPGPWTSLTLAQMVPIMREYAATIANQILSTGARVNFWDLGNEVDQGIAGVTPQPVSIPSNVTYMPPDAIDPAIGQMTEFQLIVDMAIADRISWCEEHLWPYVAALLVAARDGVRSVDRSARFSTHISMANWVDPTFPTAFWRAMQSHGYLPDMLGVSWYPSSLAFLGQLADPLGQFKATQAQVSATFGRQAFIAEFAFPSDSTSEFSIPVGGFSFTEADQLRFVQDLAEWGLESGVLGGIRWWAPDYCTGAGSSVWQGLSLFRPPVNQVSTAKPAIDAVRNAVRSHAKIKAEKPGAAIPTPYADRQPSAR